LAAYLGGLATQADNPPGVTPQTVQLGTILPLSGADASRGSAILHGLRSALEAVNGNGGIHGRLLTLIAVDGAADPADALDALRRRGVLALIGGSWSEDEHPLDDQLAQSRLSHVAGLVFRARAPARAAWSANLLPSLAPVESASTAGVPAAETMSLAGTVPEWVHLGELAGGLGVELIARAGRHLHEHALLDAADQSAGLEWPAGVPLRFASGERTGWTLNAFRAALQSATAHRPGAGPVPTPTAVADTDSGVAPAATVLPSLGVTSP
jgi:hypothetical protein